jgi:hypothetical protein
MIFFLLMPSRIVERHRRNVSNATVTEVLTPLMRSRDTSAERAAGLSAQYAGQSYGATANGDGRPASVRSQTQSLAAAGATLSEMP